MSYKPLNKQQAQEMSRPPLIADGTYPCELIEFSNTDKNGVILTDRNGEEMTKIRLKIWDNEGKERTIFTNLFWGENNKMSYRTRHFAESFKVVELYESGEMYDKFRECLHKTGLCEIYTQKARPKNDGSGGMWDEKNDIRDFVDQESYAPPKPTTQAAENFQDSDIPF